MAFFQNSSKLGCLGEKGEIFNAEVCVQASKESEKMAQAINFAIFTYLGMSFEKLEMLLIATFSKL